LEVLTACVDIDLALVLLWFQSFYVSGRLRDTHL
jgi:hypothetical protein